MNITDPKEFLEEIDMDILRDYLGYIPFEIAPSEKTRCKIQFSEPYSAISNGEETHTTREAISQPPGEIKGATTQVIKGRVLRLGDFIDTDAVSRELQ
jgi:hypothetical protein